MTPLLALGWLALVGPAAANDDLVVLYSEVETDDSATVTGFPGVFIDSVDRFGVSPNGQHWIITLTIDTGNVFDDELLIVDGTVVARDGTTSAALPAGRSFDAFDQSVRILDSGQFAFSGDLTGNTTTDDFIAIGDSSGTISLVVREGTPLPGAPVGWTADFLDSVLLTNSGAGYEVASIDGVPFTIDNAIMLDGGVFLQEQVDIPLGQFTGLTNTWQNFDFQKAWATSDSAHTLVQGDLTGSSNTDNVLVLDGTVVLQEGFPLPGGSPSETIRLNFETNSHLADNGDWMAGGTFNSTFNAWAVHNGKLVGRQGSPVVAGSSEEWAQAFTAVACNTLGDYVLVGTSDAPTNNELIAYNGFEVIARSGGPVDLDGNGLFDDNMFLRDFGTDDMTLTDDRKLFLTGTLVDGGGTNQGDFAGYIDIDNSSAGTPFCNPGNLNCNGTSTLLAGSYNPAIPSGLHLRVTNGPANEFGYFLVSAGYADPGINLSNGTFCLLDGGNPFGRYNIPGSSSNSIGQFSPDGLTFANLVGTGASAGGTGFDVPPVVPIPGNPMLSGATWNFQLWHRDSCVTTGASNFSNGLRVSLP